MSETLENITDPEDSQVNINFIEEDTKSADLAPANEEIEEPLGEQPSSESSDDSDESAQVSEITRSKKAINKLTYKYRREERARIAAEKQLEELKHAQPANVQDVVIPPLPEAWEVDDDTYKKKLAAREEAIKQQVLIDYRKENETNQKALEHQQLEERALNARLEKLDKFNSRASELGITEKTNNDIQQVLVDCGITHQIADLLLIDEDGPLIATHLATNLSDLQNLIELEKANILQAGVEFGRLKKLVSSNKQKKSAPPPATNVTGGKALHDLGPTGATYE